MEQLRNLPLSQADARLLLLPQCWILSPSRHLIRRINFFLQRSSLRDLVELARQALPLGITELHIVGGLHPSLPFSYYTEMLHALKRLEPRLQLKCFTAIEILHLAWLAKKSVRQVLPELREAGLDSLT